MKLKKTQINIKNKESNMYVLTFEEDFFPVEYQK